MTLQALELLIALFACHWAADYTHLSTKWMLDAKRFGYPIEPIAAHASVHAVLQSIVVALFDYPINLMLFTFFLQWMTHFLIDVWKGRMNVWFPSLVNPANKLHWWVFGFDQLLHAIVIVITVYFVVNA